MKILHGLILSLLLMAPITLYANAYTFLNDTGYNVLLNYAYCDNGPSSRWHDKSSLGDESCSWGNLLSVKNTEKVNLGDHMLVIINAQAFDPSGKVIAETKESCFVREYDSPNIRMIMIQTSDKPYLDCTYFV